MSNRRIRARIRDLARLATSPAAPLDPMRPDAAALPRLPLREVEPIPALKRRFLTPDNDYLRTYILGECSIIVTRETGRWHLSIAHPKRYPTWDEIAAARYRVLPPLEWFAMYLPPPNQYINLHRNCFQLKQCRDPDGPEGGAT